MAMPRSPVALCWNINRKVWIWSEKVQSIFSDFGAQRMQRHTELDPKTHLLLRAVSQPTRTSEGGGGGPSIGPALPLEPTGTPPIQIWTQLDHKINFCFDLKCISWLNCFGMLFQLKSVNLIWQFYFADFHLLQWGPEPKPHNKRRTTWLYIRLKQIKYK